MSQIFVLVVAVVVILLCILAEVVLSAVADLTQLFAVAEPA